MQLANDMARKIAACKSRKELDAVGVQIAANKTVLSGFHGQTMEIYQKRYRETK